MKKEDVKIPGRSDAQRYEHGLQQSHHVHASADAAVVDQAYGLVRPQKVGEHAFLFQGIGQVVKASFGRVVEDGHKDLHQGFEMTNAGVPDLGKCKFTVNVE